MLFLQLKYTVLRLLSRIIKTSIYLKEANVLTNSDYTHKIKDRGVNKCRSVITNFATG